MVFLPRVPVSEIGCYLSSADILLVHLKDDPLFLITIPSKIQSYLKIGIPILAAINGDAADLVERSKGGITCEPDNPQQMADSILRLIEMSELERSTMSTNGKKYYNENLSLTKGVDKFEKIFATI